MNKKLRVAGTVLLAAVATAVWTPHLLVGVPFFGGPEDSGREEPRELAAEWNAGQPLPIGLDGMEGSSATTGSNSELPAPPVTETKSAPASEEMQSLPSNFGSGRGVGAMERLVAAWADRPTSTSATIVPPRPAEPAPVHVALDSHRLELENWLRSGKLSGIIRGEETSVAVFGRRILREGEALFGGRLVVEEIHPRHVVLSVDGEPRTLELPSFEARGKTGVRAEDSVLPTGDDLAEEPAEAEAEVPR